MYPKRLESNHLRKTKNVGSHKIKINLGGLAGRWGTIKKWLLWASLLSVMLLGGVIIHKQFSFWGGQTAQNRQVTVTPEVVVLPHKSEELSAKLLTDLKKDNSPRSPTIDKVLADKAAEPVQAVAQQEAKNVIEVKASSKVAVEKPATVAEHLPPPVSSSPAELPIRKSDAKPLPSSDSPPLQKTIPQLVKSVPLPVKKAMPVQKGKEVSELLQECKELLSANRLIAGKGNTAWSCYKKVLVRDSHNADAEAGLKEIEGRYQEWAESALKQKQLPKARSYLQRLRQVNPHSRVLSDLQRWLAEVEKSVVSSPLPKQVSAPPPPSKGSAPRPSVPPQNSNSSRQKADSSRQKADSSRQKADLSRQKADSLRQKKTDSSRQKEDLSAQPVVTPRPSGQLPRPSAPAPPVDRPAPPRPANSSPRPSHESSPPSPVRPQPPRCSEIFIQESLGIQPLTLEQREFKRKSCN